ncbi:MAG TPA: hypothetical protein VMT93_04940 [Gemmatimonadaceae bacterium]|nr:hypothetical protein [Gemmatimonadaceae bacterium]
MRITRTIGVLMLAATAAAAAAQTPAPKADSAAKPEAKWEFTLAPYALMPTMQGHTALGYLPPVNVDADASTIFSHLQGGAMLYFQMRKGDWAFATDAIYMNLGQPVHQDTGWASGDLGMKQWAWEGFLFYQFIPKFEIGVGFLGNKVNGTVSATLTPGAGDTTVSRGLTKSWWLPTIAMRWTPLDGAHWHGVLFADYGGTGGSNLSWQVMPSVGYRFSHTFELALQYRWIGIDYATGSGSDYFEYDMKIFGPQVGLSFTF